MSLDLLLEEIRWEADRHNGDVLGAALQELKNIDPKEVRRAILRTLPPTCAHRRIRRKLHKARRGYEHVSESRFLCDYSIPDFYCGQDRYSIKEDVVRRYNKYSAALHGIPRCEKCFSCRVSASYSGSDHFFRKVLPSIIAEQVREAREEVQIFVTSVLNGELNG